MTNDSGENVSRLRKELQEVMQNLLWRLPKWRVYARRDTKLARLKERMKR